MLDHVRSHELTALYAAAGAEMALCTLVGVEGGFSRAVGAQIALAPDGHSVGSLSDGCLEHQLASEARAAREEGQPRLVRFGKGSPYIDFRLPCGSGLDILVDPAPDRRVLNDAIRLLDAREPASILLPMPGNSASALLRDRLYQPPLKLLLFGEGPELAAMAGLAKVIGAETDIYDRLGQFGKPMSLGHMPDGAAADRWTAILLLFHDHEWERAILGWAVETDAYYVGAQGGASVRASRTRQLYAAGTDPAKVDRIRGPIGLIPHARQPEILALSALAEIIAEYSIFLR